MKTILIAGGGSGGHITPGLASQNNALPITFTPSCCTPLGPLTARSWLQKHSRPRSPLRRPVCTSNGSSVLDVTCGHVANSGGWPRTTPLEAWSPSGASRRPRWAWSHEKPWPLAVLNWMRSPGGPTGSCAAGAPRISPSTPMTSSPGS